MGPLTARGPEGCVTALSSSKPVPTTSRPWNDEGKAEADTDCDDADGDAIGTALGHALLPLPLPLLSLLLRLKGMRLGPLNPPSSESSLDFFTPVQTQNKQRRTIKKLSTEMRRRMF
jgi:hypothetical protein